MLTWCFSYFSTAVMIHHDLNKATWRRGGGGGLTVFFVLQLLVQQPGKSRQETRQELGDRNWSRGHTEALLKSLLLTSFSIWFLMPSKTTCPGVAQWAWLPTSIVNQKNTHRYAYRPIYGCIFSNRIPSSLTCLGLCQIKKPTSTSGNLGSESRPTYRRDQIFLGGGSAKL